jgi:hypothetical protein
MNWNFFILSRVRGSVTNNNGYWIGWSDLLALIPIHGSGLQTIIALSLFYTLSVHRRTRTRILNFHLSYPANRFITVSLQRTHDVFLAKSNSFLAISEDSTQFSSDYSSVLLQRLNTQFQFPNLSRSFKLAPLYNRGTDLQKTRVTCQNEWRGPHRKHRFLYGFECIFTAPLPFNIIPNFACTCVAGMPLPNRCLAMGIHVTIPLLPK